MPADALPRSDSTSSERHRSHPDRYKWIALTNTTIGILMGFLLVTAVLVVSFGRVGDMYGRARMYNLG
ncbi:MAG TPA: hypothetical protein VND67_01120, partial [Acidimicrobiales bacterium]|nr:hypothetical protein [Acidimicrobiales bacterium]